MLGREQFSAILARVVAQPQVDGVDVPPEGPASGKRPVVAAPEVDHLVKDCQQKYFQTQLRHYYGQMGFHQC